MVRQMKQFASRSNWSRADWAMFAAVVLGWLIFAFQDGIGQIEGRLLPVTTPVVLSNPTPTPPPSYRHTWEGRATKLRECEFVAASWYLGSPDGRRVAVAFDFTDPPKVRGEGELVWTGVRISLDPDEVRQNSHAYVLHQCPWRPWLTRTPFYDSALEAT